MKRIGLTGRLEENQFEQRECFDVQWGSLLTALGFVPVYLPIESNYRQTIEDLHLDGIILSGGNDLSCINDSALSRKRDTFEKDLIELAVEKKIPLLGVCRGMQVIADYFGGEFSKVTGHVATKHDLVISKHSKYYETLKNITNTNSYHNFAVDSVPDELFVTAQSTDGSIEAIEHHSFAILGHMWHPERVEPFSENEMALIRTFFSGE